MIRTVERKKKNIMENVRRRAKAARLTNVRTRTPVMSVEEVLFTRGIITKQTRDMATFNLNKQLIYKLKDLYATSEREKAEYIGAITFEVAGQLVKFKSPTKRTNRNPVSVTAPVNIISNYIVYHSHPVPPSVPRNMTVVTLLSQDDFSLFINGYPKLQANIVLERHGFYVIDIIESTLTNKPDPYEAYQMFLGLLENKNIDQYAYTGPSPHLIALFAVSIASWKKLINVYIDKVMRHTYSMSVRYFTYDETPEITIVNPGSITAPMTLG